jgi:hypothetical protein
MFIKRRMRLFINVVLIVSVVLIPIYVINGFYTVHHVCNSMIYDAIKASVAGKLPNEGFPAITPIPYLHATILYMVTELQILQLNTIYLIMFQLLEAMFILLVILNQTTNIENLYTKGILRLASITIAVMLIYWNIYPSVIYEYGFHHQWYGVHLVAFVAILLSLYKIFKSWKKMIVSLYPFLISIPFTHPFAEVMLLSFLIYALVLIVPYFIISKVQFKVYNRVAHLIILLILSIIITYLNDALVSLTLKQYTPLLLERLKMLHEETLSYLSVVSPSPVLNPLTILSNIGFKYFVFVLNVTFPLTYYLILLYRRDPKSLYENSCFITATAFSLSLTLYPFANIALKELSFAFIQRYLYFLYILIILNGIIILNNLSEQRALAEKRRSSKIVFSTVFLLLTILLLGLFSTLLTLSSRIPLTLYYSAYRTRVVNLNLYLARHLTFTVTLTPGYYVMPQYLSDSITVVVLYAYRAGDALKKLLDTDVIIWDNPCQGICIQLRSAGLYDLDYQGLLASLIQMRSLTYNDAQLEMLLR